MQRFIAKANIDLYIGLLNATDVTTDRGTAITRLLIAEEGKLAHDLEHLDFAEGPLSLLIQINMQSFLAE